MGTIYKRGRIWWVAITSGGKRRSFSTGTDDLKEAKEILKAAETRAIARKALKKAHAELRKLDDLEMNESDGFAWARERWGHMNFRERQAVVFCLFKGRCYYCGCQVRIPLQREPGMKNRAILEHRVPASAGGSDSLTNLVLACHECNVRKGDRNPDDFSQSLDELRSKTR